MRAIGIVLVTALASCLSKPDRPTEVMPAPDAPAVPGADAPDLCVAGACETAGGTCVAGTCVIARSTATFVQCPAGMPCRVDCTGKDACKPGVSCGGATACTVRCESDTACTDHGVDCGEAASCDVTCTGASACQHHTSSGPHAIECRAAACTVACTGSSACHDGIAVTAAGTCAGTCCLGACAGDTATCSIATTTCP